MSWPMSILERVWSGEQKRLKGFAHIFRPLYAEANMGPTRPIFSSNRGACRVACRGPWYGAPVFCGWYTKDPG
jgi:hypothetical protein